MAKTKILWSEETWNPITGCSKTSEGCANCYAYGMTLRLAKNPKITKYRNGWKVTPHPECLSIPLDKEKPTVYFVNSMSDVFHADVPEKFIRRIFEVMVEAKHHTFQVLTKRSERLRELAPTLPWPDNVYMGVTVESANYYGRIADLVATPAKIKFLSLEPLLSPIPDIPLEGIDWAIVAGESGHKARPMQAQWVRDVRDKCVRMKIPFFFKQWGGKGKLNKERGRVLDGRTWEQKPMTTGK